jgi:hypothetical protein
MKYSNMEEEKRNVRSRSRGTERQEEKACKDGQETGEYDSVGRIDTKRNPPNPLPHPHIVHAVPQRDNILALPHADRAPADLGCIVRALPTRLCVRFVVLPTLARTLVGGRRATARKRLSRHRTHERLPHAVRDALPQPYNPLAPGYIERVLPHGALHSGVEEEIVGGGCEGGGGREVGCEGPEGLDLGARQCKTYNLKRRTLLNAATRLMPSS